MKTLDCRVCELPSNILVRGVNWVGDTVMTLPAMKALREIFPSAHLTFWAPAYLESLLRVSKIPDDIIVIPPRLNKLTRPLRMKSVLQKKNFDLALLFQNAFESALTVWMAGIPLRFGYPTDARGPLLNVKASLTKEIRRQHQVYYYLQLVKYLGAYFGLTQKFFFQQPDCSIFLSRQLKQESLLLLSSYLSDLDSRPVVCLCPGSVNSEAKRWPPDYFMDLARLLTAGLNASIIFMGTASEREMIENIMAPLKRENIVNLAGETDIEKTLGVMSVSNLVISNDTGSAHLAVAAGSRVLTIFGPTIPGATAPFGPGAEIITGKSDCSPCRRFSCPLPDHPCMRSIKPDDVFDRASTMIEHNRNIHGPLS